MFDLDRFIQAQEAIFYQVCLELSQGRRHTHWSWFIFPQIRGLSTSGMSVKFAISGLDEASYYIAHHLLGSRLRYCTELVCQVSGRSIQEILGVTDALKFRSCMTLFAHATNDNEVFVRALEKYFDGEYDNLTMDIINMV